MRQASGADCGPTSSQPTMSWSVFWVSTNISIEAVKRLLAEGVRR